MDPTPPAAAEPPPAAPAPPAEPPQDPPGSNTLYDALAGQLSSDPGDVHDTMTPPIPEPTPVRTMGEVLYDLENKGVEPDPNVPPAELDPNAPPAEPDPNAPPVGNKVKRIVRKEVVDPQIQPPAGPAAPPPVVAPLEPPRDPYVDKLGAQERKMYDMHKYSDDKMGTQGAAKRYLDFCKSHSKFIMDKRAENQDYNPIEDPAYHSFMQQNRVMEIEPDKIQEQIITERATKAAEDKFAPQLQELHDRVRRMQVEPETKQTFQAFNQGLIKGCMDESQHKFFTEKGAEVFKQEHPLEYDVINRHVDKAQRLGRLYLALDTGAVAFDANNQGHVFVEEFIQQKQAEFIQKGVEYTRKDGKDFARAEVFHAMPPDQQAKHWTHSSRDILGMIQAEARQQIDSDLQGEQQRLQAWAAKHGYVQQQPAASPAPVAPVAPAPVARAPQQPPSPAPRPAEPNPAPQPGGSSKLFSTLGM